MQPVSLTKKKTPCVSLLQLAQGGYPGRYHHNCNILYHTPGADTRGEPCAAAHFGLVWDSNLTTTGEVLPVCGRCTGKRSIPAGNTWMCISIRSLRRESRAEGSGRKGSPPRRPKRNSTRGTGKKSWSASFTQTSRRRTWKSI